MGALQGIKVLDFTHYIAGPYCCQTLADHGAEVIKVEPINGEPSRKGNPVYNNESIYFQSMNRNKRSLSIDMKSADSKEIIRKLVESADILVTNYSIGVPERLGIGYDLISKINPKIIMVHITGFGLTGPMKDQLAFDGAIQAISGIAHLTGDKSGPPLKAGVFIADHIAAFNATTGALLALQSRTLTGKGQLVDVSMLDSMVAMQLTNLTEVSLLKGSPARFGSRSANVFAANFPTKDGHIYLAPLAEKMWSDFCAIIGNPEFAEETSKFSHVDGRLGNYDELEQIISDWTTKWRSDEIVALLNEKRIPCGKVNTIEDLLEDEHLKSREMLLNFDFQDKEIIIPGVPVKLSDENVEMKSAPELGEHTGDILKEIGFSCTDIQAFADSGTVRLSTAVGYQPAIN